MSTTTRPRIAARGGLTLSALGLLAAAVSAVTVDAARDLASPVHRPESALVVAVGAFALAALAWLGVALLTLTVQLMRSATVASLAPAGIRLLPRGAQRALLVLLVGAGALGPGLASAATTTHPARAVMASTDSPVDPTYLGGQQSSAPPATVAPTPQAPTAQRAPQPPIAHHHASRPGVPARTSAPTPAPTGHQVVVRRGDTLWGIAARLLAHPSDAETARAVHQLYAANADVIGSDPDLIRPGTHLQVPAGLAPTDITDPTKELR